MTIIESPSPNHNERRAAIDMLVLHYTNMPDPASALARLCDPATEVSAHYLVEENGAIHALVPEDRRAWHAGKSYWDGETDLNSRSIGIEIANAGHDGGLPSFPQVQMDALLTLCKAIQTRHKILNARILGHSDIAPARKDDPGERFNWRWLAENGIGLWPSATDQDYAAADAMLAGPIRAALTTFGYDPNVDLKTIIAAFQRHFQPEAFPDAGKADIETAARLSSLLRLKSKKA